MFPPRLPPPDFGELSKEEKAQLQTFHLIVVIVTLAIIITVMYFMGSPK